MFTIEPCCPDQSCNRVKISNKNMLFWDEQCNANSLSGFADNASSLPRVTLYSVAVPVNRYKGVVVLYLVSLIVRKRQQLQWQMSQNVSPNKHNSRPYEC